MKPFHLQVQFVAESRQLNFRWFGQSAIRVEGSRDLPRRAGAHAVAVSDNFLIDLVPLLAEISAGAIAAADDFRAADEFLLLADLLADDDFEELCETLYHFLWREAQRGPPETVRTFAASRAEIDPDHRLVRVWFATNRKPVEVDDIIERFASEESADEITYGVCNVFIPKSHKPGSTGSAWWRRWIRLEADDTLSVRGTHALPRDVFWKGLADKLETWWKPGERNAFVLIHGYNVSFEEAAIRAAQIGYDLKVPGEMAFYSWPSHGSWADYSADDANIRASVDYIAQFLRELSEHSGAERIHLFVHSMGNQGLLDALERIIADGHGDLQFGQIFFCAPDEDVRTFEKKTTKFPHRFENRTLLVSANDQAVALSKWKHKKNRVGIVPPVLSFAGIETIEVGGFGLLDMGHDYFATAERVILDMREAIETRKRAADREIPQAFEDHYTIDIRHDH